MKKVIKKKRSKQSNLWKFLKQYFLAVLLFFLSSVLFLHKDRLLFSLSPQGAIDPDDLISSYDPLSDIAIFDNRPVSIPYSIARVPEPQVLGELDANKRIEIDLAGQRLYAYEGSQQVFNFLISSGKWGRTPTGIFRIWTKLRYTKMEGGSRLLSTYYNLPNVPYTMFFYNEKVPRMKGYGIHGAYWHNNFGHPMSHGCINMKIEEAGLLYYWAHPELSGKPSIAASGTNLGTEIYIYGKPADV